MNKRIKKKRLTANQAQYERQIQRLSRRTFPKLSLQGVQVDYSLLEEKNFQRISHKRIEMLRKVNAKNIQSYYDFEEYVLQAEAQRNYREQQKQSKENANTYKENLSFTPDMSIVDRIKQMIEEIPDVKTALKDTTVKSGYEVSYSVRKQTLLNLLDEQLVENEEYINEYIQHLKDNEERLLDVLDKFQYRYVYEDEIEESLVEVANIINWGVIDENIASQLSIESEYY